MTKKQIKHFLEKGKPIKDFKEMTKMLNGMAEKARLRKEFESKKEKNAAL